MGKQKMTPIGIACILLVLLVVAFMVRGSLREPEKIVLPPEPSTTEPSGPTVDNEAVDRVEVRPDTVQSGSRGRLAADRRHGDGRADPPCHHRR